MTKRQWIQRNRKWHRYLGVILGIQLLLWTAGGLYFSWTNIDEIRGDHLKKAQSIPIPSQDLVSPTSFIKPRAVSKDSIRSIELINILGQPFYRLIQTSENGKNTLLFDAITGFQRPPLTEKEAVLVATEGLNVSAEITKIERIQSTGKHHEYRGRPLPAYAITFSQPANTTIYVSENYGNIQTFRSNKWRAFDFLWMLHTMDYEGRDNFNNLLLRAFALFGLFTILSGFSLYIFTSRIFSKKPSK
ncbi:PepSY domain-containing protein [Flagellimonas onchidii]|uniref:PepSY domain-containing protein n=1 Tax=Flagellimonas onchidii TaxID=2562684 RepID=UPI0010A5BD36|nr:PepSY domain-containing protein [Allomuricauda onchidii]